LELQFMLREELPKSKPNFKKKSWRRIRSRQENLGLQNGRVNSNKLENGSKLSRISNNKLNVTKFSKEQMILANKKTKLKTKKLKFKLLREQDYFLLMTKCKARLKSLVSNSFK
jgi:hypothetical protein